MQIVLDFETYSSTPISCGAYKYAASSDTDIVCLAYKVDDSPVELWLPGQPVPREFGIADTFYAHNALFDYLIWAHVGVNKYDFPKAPLANWIDTIALANRWSYPAALNKLGDILELDTKKQAGGVGLIKRICIPDASGNRPTPLAYDLELFYDYCRDDVKSTYDLLQALPADKLSRFEASVWLLTQQINIRGLPIDIETTKLINYYVSQQAKEQVKELPKITNGAVTKPTQVKRIREWLLARGYDLPDLRAQTVSELLDSDNLPEDVHTVLSLREAFGRSSTAKFEAMINYEYHGRARDSFQYYGAHTGRWAGRGIQPQNFPRARVDSPYIAIEKFKTFQPVENVTYVAKALVRSMICAPHDKLLLVHDYSSIENRVIAYLVEDEETLRGFEKGFDQYLDMAAFLYNKPYESLTKDSPERQMGKMVILGCGYGMGYKHFKDVAGQWGIKLTEHEAREAVNAYRSKYNLVYRAWYDMYEAAKTAIYNPGKIVHYKRVYYQVQIDRNGNSWLTCFLKPSQRFMVYADPKLDNEDRVTHMGLNSYTKKWERLALRPGTMLQNPTQALARDIMAHGLLYTEQNMPKVKLIGTVHDEAIAEINKKDASEELSKEFGMSLCKRVDGSDWPGLPLKTSGYIARRYKK